MRFSPLYHRLCGGRLRHGPFRGMRYVQASIGSSYGAKLLGTYELELHGVFDTFAAHPFHSIVNVGAAEGYYAVGLARRYPKARVVAFETEAEGQALIWQMARLNRVDDRVEVAGHCDPETLQQRLKPHSLVWMDVEGAEGSLLDPQIVPILTTCTIVVETHDYLMPGVTDLLRQRFTGSHDITEISTHPRTLADLPLAFRLLFQIAGRRYAASVLNEGRPAAMQWLVLEHRRP